MGFQRDKVPLAGVLREQRLLSGIPEGRCPIRTKKPSSPKNGTKACKSIRVTTQILPRARTAASQRTRTARTPAKESPSPKGKPCRGSLGAICAFAVPGEPVAAYAHPPRRFSPPLRGDPHRTPALRTCTILRLALRLVFGAFPFTELSIRRRLLPKPSDPLLYYSSLSPLRKPFPKLLRFPSPRSFFSASRPGRAFFGPWGAFTAQSENFSQAKVGFTSKINSANADTYCKMGSEVIK